MVLINLDNTFIITYTQSDSADASEAHTQGHKAKAPSDSREEVNRT